MGPTLFKRSRAEYYPLEIRAKNCADGNAVSTEAAIWHGGSSMLMAMVFLPFILQMVAQQYHSSNIQMAAQQYSNASIN
jgi:hypothetical protein